MMPRLKWWQWGLIGFVGVGLVGAVVMPPPGAVDASADEGAAKILSTTPLGSTRGVYAMTVTPGSGAMSLEARARQTCGSLDQCDVVGWEDESLRAKGWPMTEREAQGVVFSYKLNRATGYEASVWNCNLFPDAPASRCMSAENSPTS